MPSPSVWPLVAWLAGTLAALIAVRIGWRWRREAIPPTCRRCGYDVSRRPQGVERCSECGAVLHVPNAIITTRGSPRHPLIVVPILAALVLLGITSQQAIRFPWFAWYIHHAPTPWIVAMAKRNHGVAFDAYRQEWFDRGQLRGELFDHLLDVQSDASTPMLGKIFTVVEDAFRDGTLSASQRERFMKAIPGTTTVRVRKKVRVGDPIPCRVSGTGARVSPSVQPIINLSRAVDRAPPLIFSNGVQRLFPVATVGTSGWIPWQDSMLASTQLGHHSLKAVIGWRIYSLANGYAPLDFSTPPASGEFELVRAGTAVGMPIIEPSKADTVSRSIDLRCYRGNSDVVVKVQLLAADVDRGFNVFAVVNGEQIALGCVAASAGKTSSTADDGVALFSERPADEIAPDGKLTLRFVGAGEALIRTIDQENYWAGRITFDDISIAPKPTLSASTRPGPTERPTAPRFRVEPATQ